MTSENKQLCDSSTLSKLASRLHRHHRPVSLHPHQSPLRPLSWVETQIKDASCETWESFLNKTAAQKNKPQGIKLLYVGNEFGAGHISQAKNLAAAATARGIPTELIDFHRTFAKPRARQPYERAVKKHLDTLSLGTALQLGKEHLSYYLSGIDNSKVKAWADKNKDQAIVVTMPHLRQALKDVDNPVHILHTDPKKWTGVSGSEWFEEGPRVHIGTKATVEDLGGSDERKALRGLPVHPDVLKSQKKTGLMGTKDYNITVSGGALGMEVLPMVRRVLEADLPDNAVIHAVAGKNKKLLRKLERLAKKNPQIHPHGFAPLRGMMREADLNVIRAHGTTFAETVASGKPAVYYTPDPSILDYQGQLTKDTAEYGKETIGNPAAIGLTKLPGAVTNAIHYEERYKRIAERARKRMGDPADVAIRYIMKPRKEYTKSAATVDQADIKMLKQHLKTAKAHKLSRRMKFRGLDVSIETDKGELRHWYDPHKKESGTTKMTHPYGYIRRTKGVDGDHVDVYVGPNEDAKNVYVVHQMTAPDFKKFDEDKCFLGFDNAADAKAAYLKNFDDPRFFGSMTTMPWAEFEDKVRATFEQPKKIAAVKVAGPRWKALQQTAETYKMWKPKLFGALTGGLAGGAAGGAILPGVGAIPGAILGSISGAGLGRAVGGAGRTTRALHAGLTGKVMKPIKIAYLLGAQEAQRDFNKEAEAALGDPMFWQGGQEGMAPEGEAAPAATAEDAALQLPPGIFQGLQMKVNPAGERSTTVKVTPDALQAPDALAGIFQAEPNTKVEMSMPQAGGEGGAAGGGPNDMGIPEGGPVDGAGAMPPEMAGGMPPQMGGKMAYIIAKHAEKTRIERESNPDVDPLYPWNKQTTAERNANKVRSIQGN